MKISIDWCDSPRLSSVKRVCSFVSYSSKSLSSLVTNRWALPTNCYDSEFDSSRMRSFSCGSSACRNGRIISSFVRYRHYVTRIDLFFLIRKQKPNKDAADEQARRVSVCSWVCYRVYQKSLLLEKSVIVARWFYDCVADQQCVCVAN